VVMVVVTVVVMTSGRARGEHPRDASNWQGKHACGAAARRAATPKTVRDVSEIVYGTNGGVRANGAGHSWHEGLFCAETRIDARETRSVAAPGRFAVDDDAMVVRADAGMSTRDLLDGIAEMGYALPAVPWFIDQTIGGAVATATHGSSLSYGSVSSQMVACTIVKADGSVAHFAENDESTSPALFNALRASVGRLGVLVDVTLRVVKNSRIARRSADVTPDAFVDEMMRVQEAVRACEREHDIFDEQWACAMRAEVVRALDETQFFWYIPLAELSRVTFIREDAPAQFQPYDEAASNSSALSAINLGSLSGSNLIRRNPRRVRDITSPVSLMSADSMARGWARQWKRATLSNIADGTSSQRESFLTMTERQYDLHRRYGYEQLEVAVPLRKAGECMRAFNEALYDDRQLNLGFRSQALLRFVGPESAWLSPAHGRLGTLYVNIEDFIKYSRVIDSRGNPRFDAAVRLLRGERCDGRLHWGKYGFPSKSGCFDGAKEYGVAFCHFGCQAHALDPNEKFAGDSDSLRFPGIDFDACCDADDALFNETRCACVLADRRPSEECEE